MDTVYSIADAIIMRVTHRCARSRGASYTSIRQSLSLYHVSCTNVITPPAARMWPRVCLPR